MPLIVIRLLAQLAVTPAGRSTGVPIPVAPVVVWVILVINVLTHNVGVDEAVPAIGRELTVTAKFADTVPLPHELVPRTVRFPLVAFDAKLIVMEFVVPLVVAPVPEYAHV